MARWILAVMTCPAWRSRAVVGVAALVAALLRPAASHAADIVDVFGPWADLGVGMRMQVLEVRAADGSFGELRELRFVPTVTVGTPTLTFGKTDLGIALIWNYTSFDLDRQWTGKGWTPADYGTSASGFASYLVPTLTFTRHREESSAWVRGGIGFGYGYLRAKGTVLLNLPRGNDGVERADGPVVHTFDIKRQGWALSLLAEWHWEPFTLAFGVAGPGLTRDEGINYYDVGMTLSYSWYRAKRQPPAPTPAGPAGPAAPATPAPAPPPNPEGG